MINAEVVCDSISNGNRITSFILEYPRFIHSELMTHRVFSKNAASSRAIPIEKMIQRVSTNPAMPTEWGMNNPGMQSKKLADHNTQVMGVDIWYRAMYKAVESAKEMVKIGIHKQIANRLLEPFAHMQIILTATEYDNFFEQRISEFAQPEIFVLAKAMKYAMDNSTPEELRLGKYHLPLIDVNDFLLPDNSKLIDVDTAIKVSVARCARTSYGLNTRNPKTLEEDLKLYDMLLTQKHWSPLEHQATPMKYNKWEGANGEIAELFDENGVTYFDSNYNFWSGNFKGWIQYRQLLQNS